MENNNFDPKDFLDPTQENTVPNSPPSVEGNLLNDIELICREVEKKQLDLTSSYENWLLVGFALAEGLGEIGRSYFHRLSKFYHKYSYAEANKKYDSFLKNNNHKTTIKSLFYLAKLFGIEIREKKTPVENQNTEKEQERNEELMVEENKFNTPSLPQQVYENLPKLLKDITKMFSEGIEKDIMLLSSITVLSACLPNLSGVYFNKSLSPHLYLFIVGPSASGKGTMVWSRYLAQQIHDELFKGGALLQAEYVKALEEYERLPKKEKATCIRPTEPPRKMLFLPANSSTAAFTQLLAENEYSGLIFESEADTISNTAKQDWGDSSDIFRKAFHHENTSMARRTNRELIEITNPHLAICISGTPKQVHTLMPDVENGLFSRFMYYAFQDTRGFINPFVSYQPFNYHEYFTRRSYEVFHFYEKLKKLNYPVYFKLTDKQANDFTAYFQTLLDKNKLLLSRDLDANTKRLGVITFRIAMILTAIRLMDMEIGTKIKGMLICSDQDYETAKTIATILESHAVAVYQNMPKVGLKGMRLTFYERLPKTFDRKGFMAVAQDLGISSKTAIRYIDLFKNKLIDHKFNEYTKKIE